VLNKINKLLLLNFRFISLKTLLSEFGSLMLCSYVMYVYNPLHFISLMMVQSEPKYVGENFDVLLTVHLIIFISVFNLYMFRAHVLETCRGMK